jgi:hypothetical protein
MKCPHCLDSFHSSKTVKHLFQDVDFFWDVATEECPSCKKGIIYLRTRVFKPQEGTAVSEFLVYPKGVSRTPLSKDVPDKFAQDYKEACLVLCDSSKASAALSRRCLQNIIREVAGIEKSDLNNEIEELLKSRTLPTNLAGSVDAVRVVGNFAAHPIKSTNSGEVVDVEPGEAEWSLDVLEGLFDFYFVQPAELKRKRDLLNKKLADAGKPPIK